MPSDGVIFKVNAIFFVAYDAFDKKKELCLFTVQAILKWDYPAILNESGCSLF